MVLSKCHATLFPPISLVGSSGASLAPVHSFGNALAPAGSTVAASLIGPHLPEPCPAGLALLAFDSQPLAWWPYLPCRMTDNKQNNNHTGHHGIIPQHTISHPVLGSLVVLGVPAQKQCEDTIKRKKTNNCINPRQCA